MALRHGCDAQQPSGTCHLHLDKPPPWSSTPHLDIRLVVAVNAHAQSATDGALLRRCLCTVHEHHPLAWIHVVDNGSPDERSIAAAISPRVRFCRFSHYVGIFRGIAEVVHHAVHRDATHLAFLEHRMRLLRPLPLLNLPCHFTSYHTYRPLTKHASVVHTELNFSDLLQRNVTNSKLGAAAEFIARGFVTSSYGMQQLATYRIFNHSSVRHVCSPEDAETESFRALSIFTALHLHSPLPDCSLDGCAEDGVQRCAELRYLHDVLPPVLDLTISQPSACASLVSGESSNGLDAGSGGDAIMLLNRFVAPPVTLASDVLARLEPDGTVHYGAGALAVSDGATQADADRLLLYLHFYSENAAEALHLRQVMLPLMQALPLIQQSAILLFCNNRNRTTASIVARLRRYPQRSRWLIHSPYNVGYLCGEFASLASSTHVWARYGWVLHTHFDVVITPEFFFRLRCDLS